VLETSDWGFCLSDLNSVESAIQYIVWHGDADHDVPFEVAINPIPVMSHI
jgi:hypothetical protein